MSNGTLLAIELLSSESDEVVLDEHDVTEKAAEIDGALARVFEIAPELATTRVSPTRVPGNVIVGAGGELAAAFSDIDVSPPIHTGNQAFDELGERLGLWAVNGGSVILLCVSDFVNIERAVEAYAGIRGVRYAESNGIVRIPEDQSDIQATPSGSEWHILISPRCYPDFCPDRFFVVSSGGVREMNTATAQ